MAGYIGNAPVPQATQTRDNFTATAGQTSFATSGYTPGYLDVYLNGVRLDESDYTATNGSDVVLDTGAAVDDVVSVVAFQTFEVNAGISLDDNVKAKFGDGDDLQIYHNGSASYIEDVGTGGLAVTTNGAGIYLQKGATETLAQFGIDGESSLYYDNAKKLATTSSGVDVTGTVTADGLALDNSNGNGTINIVGGNTDNGSKIQAWNDAGTGDGYLAIEGYTKEYGRFDSSGNLLVGKTTASFATAGMEYFASTKQTGLTTDGDYALALRRLNSDGEILQFKKNGTTVGSIGSEGGDSLFIGSGDTGLHFSPAELLRPWNPSTNSARDNAVSLGSSTVRFKDLYLSGGVYLGGTGSANHLDDYEEGTWTCSIGGYGASTTSRTAYYTKVGRLVTLQVEYQSFATSAGSGSTDVTIEGVPFNITESATGKVGLKVGFGSNQGVSLYSGGGANANKFLLYSDSGTSWNRLQGSEFSSLALGFVIQYIT